MNTKQFNFIYFLPLVGIAFFALSYYSPSLVSPVDNVYLSMSIFLFATLSGFFISRQAARYSQIIGFVANFDGILTSLFRTSSLVSEDVQEKTKTIIKNHYKFIIKAQNWDSYFKQKTTTITDITNLLAYMQENIKEMNDLQKNFIGRSGYGAIVELQKIRKNLIVLYKERIPSFQWLLMDSLALILLVSVYAISTNGTVFPSLVKGAFAAVVVAVLVLLRKLNNLTLFESMTGQASAQDVLDVINNKK